MKLEIRFTAGKLARLISLLQEWQGKKACHPQEGAAVPDWTLEPC